jgi:hypothetical protein
MYLLLPEEVPDLDGCVGVGDGGVDGEVSVDEAHLVAVSLGDAGDEVLDVGDGGADGGHGAAGAEPGVDLELAATVLELEVEVEVLEVAGQLAARPLHSHNLGSHLHGDPLGDIHRLRSQDGLHLLRRPTCERGGEERRRRRGCDRNEAIELLYRDSVRVRFFPLMALWAIIGLNVSQL